MAEQAILHLCSVIVDVVTYDECYDANRANWSERVAGHWMPDGYDAAGFIADENRITGVVQFDHPYLGNLEDRSLLQLQCHFGMDTLSLARLGAIVTGIDFSPEAPCSCKAPQRRERHAWPIR